MNSQPVMEDPKLASMRVSATYGACIYTLVIFEWLSHLPKEWKYIWRGRPSLVSALYLILRYWPIPKFAISIYLNNTTMDFEECSKWSNFQVYANLPLTVAISLLLTLRVYAVYERNKFVLGGLLACIATMVPVIAVACQEFGAPAFISGVGPCFASAKKGASNIKISLWLAPFAFDVLTTGLLIIRVFMVRKRGATHSGLLRTLVQDGLSYFMVISIVNLINVGFLLGAKPAFQTVNSGMAYMVGAMASCRLVLSLRESGDREATVTGAGLSGDKDIGLSTFNGTRSRPGTTAGVAKVGNLVTTYPSNQATHVAFNTKGYRGKEMDDVSEEERAVQGVFIVTERHTVVDSDAKV